jgi:hypothetical protein
MRPAACHRRRPRWPPIGRARPTATAATSPGSSTEPPTRPCPRPRRRPCRGKTGAGGHRAVPALGARPRRVLRAPGYRAGAGFGRTKPDSVEFTGAGLPPNAHIARTQSTTRMATLPIYRRSVPYGARRARPPVRRVLGRPDPLTGCWRGDVRLRPDGLHDRTARLLAKPVTGAYYYAPPLSVLAALPKPRQTPPPARNLPGGRPASRARS